MLSGQLKRVNDCSYLRLLTQIYLQLTKSSVRTCELQTAVDVETGQELKSQLLHLVHIPVFLTAGLRITKANNNK